MEDDRRVAQLVRWLLEDAGMTVEEARDDRDVAALASSADVVIVDIAMAGCGGLSALEQMHAEGVTTPVVVFSAYAQPYLRGAAAMLGAVDFVDKATEADRLVDAVRSAGRHRHASQ